MKNITISRKTKIIALLISIIAVFSLGAFARPSVDIAVMLASSVFVSNETYVAPPSEYEAKVNELWQSQRHQAVCKANAAATVAIQLARKYLEEGEKQSALSQYDTPLSEAVKTQGNYGKR